MKVRKYENGVINEFDSLDELRLFDGRYFTDAGSAILKKICGSLSCREEELSMFRRIGSKDNVLMFSFRKGVSKYIYDGQDASLRLLNDD